MDENSYLELEPPVNTAFAENALAGPVAVLRRMREAPATRIFFVLVAMAVVFSVLRPSEFATTYVLRSIADDTSILLILAVGMTFVIVTTGIDLSPGSVLVFASVISAYAMVTWHLSPILGLFVALLGGSAWGLLNGLLITKAKVSPLIVTLGSLLMALGAAQLITGGIDIANIPPSLVNDIGFGKAFGAIPWLIVIGLAVAIVGGVTLSQTRFGRYTYAIGSNPESARRAGINVDRHLIKIYMLMGCLAGLAGYLTLARFATTSISGHTTDNLQVIAGVVLGGTSLFGGRGTMIGTCIGMLIPVTLQYGFIVLGIQPFWENVAVGATLIIAVFLDQLKRRTSGR